MNQLAVEPVAPADSDLLRVIRSGETEAYARLYERHAAAARALAAQLVRGPAEVDDVVSEAFAKVLDLLRRGGGPADSFRPYLLTAVRRAAYDRHRLERRQLSTDSVEEFDPGEPFEDPAVAGLEQSMIARAFRSLPERWQAVLWHTEVEAARPAEVADLLGLSANSVAALAYRAREGLRQAYLQMHLSDGVRPECRPLAGKLGGYVRGGLSDRDTAKVAAHLDDCTDCRAVYTELSDVNGSLRGVVAVIFLGPLAGGYLSTVARGGGAPAKLGLLGWIRRAPRHQQAAVAGGTLAAAAGVAAATVALAAGVPAPAAAHSHRVAAAASPAAAPPSPVPAPSPAPASSRRPVASPHPGPVPTGRSGSSCDRTQLSVTPTDVLTPRTVVVQPRRPSPAGTSAAGTPAPGAPVKPPLISIKVVLPSPVQLDLRAKVTDDG
jgi:RNA polymerase sigma factor (sigma-70 family)